MTDPNTLYYYSPWFVLSEGAVRKLEVAPCNSEEVSSQDQVQSELSNKAILVRDVFVPLRKHTSKCNPALSAASIILYPRWITRRWATVRQFTIRLRAIANSHCLLTRSTAVQQGQCYAIGIQVGKNTLLRKYYWVCFE